MSSYPLCQNSSRSASLVDYSRNAAGELASEENRDQPTLNVLVLEPNYQFQVSTQASEVPMTEQQFRKILREVLEDVIQPIRLAVVDLEIKFQTLDQDVRVLDRKLDTTTSQLQQEIDKLNLRFDKRMQRIEYRMKIIQEISIKKGESPMKYKVRAIQGEREYQEYERVPKRQGRMESYELLGPSSPTKLAKSFDYQSYQSQNASQIKRLDRNTENQKYEETSPERHRMVESYSLSGPVNTNPKMIKSVGYQDKQTSQLIRLQPRVGQSSGQKLLKQADKLNIKCRQNIQNFRSIFGKK